MVDGIIHHRPEPGIPECMETVFQFLPYRTVLSVMVPVKTVAQVSRQDQEAFDQRSDDHADYHERDVEQDRTDDPGHHHQWQKRGHRGHG